jgi:hypothetical protein
VSAFVSAVIRLSAASPATGSSTLQIADAIYRTAVARHKLNADQYLYQRGYVRTVIYQPAGRLWALQSIEAGGLIILSVGLTRAAVWLVRRRGTA